MRKILQLIFLFVIIASLSGIVYITIDKYYLTPNVAKNANNEALKVDKDKIAENIERINNKNKIIVTSINDEKSNKNNNKISTKINKNNNQNKIKQATSNQNINNSNINNQSTNNKSTNNQNIDYQSPTYNSGDPNISYNPNVIRSISRIPLNSSINPDYKIGEIYIPSVQLHLAIMEGLTNENLNVASGTMKPGQEMGKRNYAIAGHHAYTNILFTPLMNIQLGNKIYITDKSEVYEYKVTNLKYLTKNDGYVIDDSEGDKIITLITCSDPQGTKRYMVRGKLIKHYNLTNASNELKTQFQ